MEEAPSAKNNFWPELFKLIVISLVIVIPFRLYIAKPFIVNGSSMDPTFESGDYLIVDELTYQFKEPERSSVVIFKFPLDPSKSYIKRIIGLPGETISIEKGWVTIFNKENPEGFTLDEPYVALQKTTDEIKVILDEGEYFVLGDNRAASADSRYWGTLPEKNIIGRPIIRFFPPAVFPGDYSKKLDFNN